MDIDNLIYKLFEFFKGFNDSGMKEGSLISENEYVVIEIQIRKKSKLRLVSSPSCADSSSQPRLKRR
jgi:hypothetical protein